MTRNLKSGESGMSNNTTYRVDLEWQYIMLTHHVASMLKDMDKSEGSIKDSYIESLRERLKTIQQLREDEDEACKPFAQTELAMGHTVNTWPSSQLCMDCTNGVFMMSPDLPSSTYACGVGTQLGPCDNWCDTFEEKLEEI